MSISEFGLIERYFAAYQPVRSITRLGIGDDCALLRVPDGYELAVTTDTMVEGVHFFAGADPADLGHKLLAVNLSDLASMGAEPIAVTLALTIPAADEQWLSGFAHGFMQLAQRYRVDLIGGDTTAGPLTLTVQAMGIVSQQKAILRSGAKVGDLIYVTGQLGNAGLGLKIKQGYACTDSAIALQQFNTPEPRVEQGLKIRGLASACVDLSDGLTQDLNHILRLSKVGACLNWKKIPLADSVIKYMNDTGDWLMPLTAGDDYELCFTVPPHVKTDISSFSTCIGAIEQEPGLRINREGQIQTLKAKGYEHFS